MKSVYLRNSTTTTTTSTTTTTTVIFTADVLNIFQQMLCATVAAKRSVCVYVCTYGCMCVFYAKCETMLTNQVFIFFWLFKCHV